MFQHIVVPLDGSSLAEGILSAVNQLAHDLKANVELLVVVDRHAVRSNRPSGDRFSNGGSEDAVALAETYLKGLAGRFQLPAVQVTVTVAVERVPEGIARVAEERSNTLIAISTHGHSGIGRFVLGSVAAEVILETRVPVLLYRRKNENAQVEKLVTAIVPLDGSSLAEHVLGTVRELATSLSLQVVLVRVLSVAEASLGMGADWLNVYDSNFVAIASYLAAKEEELKHAGIKVRTESLEGDEAGVIIDLLRRTPNAFVIMATNGRPGPGQTILGSVAHQVVRNASGPILLLRP